MLSSFGITVFDTWKTLQNERFAAKAAPSHRNTAKPSFLFKALRWASFRDGLLLEMGFFWRFLLQTQEVGFFSRLLLQILKLTTLKQ